MVIRSAIINKSNKHIDNSQNHKSNLEGNNRDNERERGTERGGDKYEHLRILFNVTYVKFDIFMYLADLQIENFKVGKYRDDLWILLTDTCDLATGVS